MRSKFHLAKQPLIAFLTPLIQAYRSGHIRSSFTRTSVDVAGRAIPWYSLPAVHFLSQRDFRNSNVLEFGGGHSTIWWSSVANNVTTFEEDQNWIDKFVSQSGPNVRAFQMRKGLKGGALRSAVREILSNEEADPEMFDIVVVDAMHRETLVEFSFDLVKPTGLVIVDNSEGYDVFEITRQQNWLRVDFIGPANGVSSQHSTSIFFRGNCPHLSSCHSISWN